MLDEGIRSGIVNRKFAWDKAFNDRILKQAQQELRKEGRLKRQPPLSASLHPTASKNESFDGHEDGLIEYRLLSMSSLLKSEQSWR
jgi:hypothetical protein